MIIDINIIKNQLKTLIAELHKMTYNTALLTFVDSLLSYYCHEQQGTLYLFLKRRCSEIIEILPEYVYVKDNF